MKHKKAALDVDFIGGEGALTPEEEKALSAYFQQKKLAKLVPSLGLHHAPPPALDENPSGSASRKPASTTAFSGC